MHGISVGCRIAWPAPREQAQEHHANLFQADQQGLFYQAGSRPVVHPQPGRRAQTDVVEDAVEADTLDDHLDAMFAPDAPPLAWDAAAEYTRSRLELYYLAHAADPLGGGALAEVGAV